MLSRLRDLQRHYRKLLHSLADVAILTERARRKADYDNPIGRCSGKVFSQADEDGMIAEILRRIGLVRGTFCEFGVGDGRECNTLALAAQGWRGFWVGGEPLCFPRAGIDPQFFRFEHSWVDLDNIVTLFRRNADAMGLKQVDVLSFDLDSRDLFFLEKLLVDGLRPALVIAEYNAKFLPPIRWSVAPDDTAPWQFTDYMGASLASLVDVFARFEYRLVACNPASGANAFFVRNDFSPLFEDVPREMEKLFVPPFFELPSSDGHSGDPRTVVRSLQIGQAISRGDPRPEHAPGAHGG